MNHSNHRRTPQTGPAPSAPGVQFGHNLALALRAAYLMMHRRANAVFARFDLTADQFVLLTSLADGDGVTQKTLAQRIHSDPNTMSEMIGRLERRGLLVRVRHAEDRRAFKVSLTEAGWEAQRRAMEGVASFCGGLADLVPADERETLLDHLKGIAGGMSAPSSPLPRDVCLR